MVEVQSTMLLKLPEQVFKSALFSSCPAIQWQARTKRGLRPRMRVCTNQSVSSSRRLLKIILKTSNGCRRPGALVVHSWYRLIQRSMMGRWLRLVICHTGLQPYICSTLRKVMTQRLSLSLRGLASGISHVLRKVRLKCGAIFSRQTVRRCKMKSQCFVKCLSAQNTP